MSSSLSSQFGDDGYAPPHMGSLRARSAGPTRRSEAPAEEERSWEFAVRNRRC